MKPNIKKNELFYCLTSETGLKSVNINNIAIIEPFANKVKITLNLNGPDDKAIQFIADLDYSLTIAELRVAGKIIVP